MNAFLARTADRIAERAPVAEDCEHEAIDERPSDDPKGVEYLMDADCDGAGDYVIVKPDNRREPMEVLLDEDGHRKIDTVILDEGHDGSAVRHRRDGRFDLRGLYRRGEDDPYRYEKIKE